MMNDFATAKWGAGCLAMALAIGVGAAAAQSGGETGSGEPLEFTHVLDDSPLDVYTPRSGEVFTEAVEQFHMSGENPYSGDDEAIAEGQDIFNTHCRACHADDGSGGMGPALNDEEYRRERAATHKGMFEIIYGGSAGAMQPFAERLTQDEILRVIAFIDTFGDAEAAE